jgi:ABC-2 type transport system permease protein
VPLLLVALASVLSAAVAILLISLAFEKIATRKSGEVKTEYKAKSMSSSSAVVALIKKELLRFFGSAMYIINAGIGIVFTVLFSGYMLFKLDSFESIVSAYGTFLGVDISELLTVALVGILIACISFSYISACSISLEGKNLWVLKSLPLRAWEVLLAKMLTHIILVLPLALVSSVLLLIASGDYNYAWYYLLMPVFACVASSAFGIIINVRFPKLDFTNEAMVIKQSLASTVAMLCGMAFGIGITVLSAFILCKTNLLLATLLPLLLTSLIAVSLVVVVFKVSTKRYEALRQSSSLPSL